MKPEKIKIGMLLMGEPVVDVQVDPEDARIVIVTTTNKPRKYWRGRETGDTVELARPSLNWTRPRPPE